MSEPNRSRRFDGFDLPSGNAAQVPEAGLDRILEALTRSRRYLPSAVEAKLVELWDRDTALAFAVLLALWAGLQFTAAGWLADLLLLGYGLLSIARDLADLVVAGKEASDAETEAELEQAAQKLAAALTESTADVIAGIIGGAVFVRFRRLVRAARAKLLPRRFSGANELQLTLGERIAGAAGGVSLERGAAGLVRQKKKLESTADALWWAAATAAGVVVVGGAVYLVRRGSP